MTRKSKDYVLKEGETRCSHCKKVYPRYRKGYLVQKQGKQGWDFCQWECLMKYWRLKYIDPDAVTRIKMTNEMEKRDLYD